MNEAPDHNQPDEAAEEAATTEVSAGDTAPGHDEQRYEPDGDPDPDEVADPAREEGSTG
jgi:hypothetical protein